MSKLHRLIGVISVACLLIVSGCFSESKPTDRPRPRSAPETISPEKSSATAASSDRATQLMQQGKLDEAYKEASSVLLSRADDPVALLVIATVERERGNLASSQQTIDSIPVDDSPFSAIAQNMRAVWLIEQGRWSDAEQALQSQLKLIPNEPTLTRTYIEILNREGRRYEALSLVHQLIIQNRAAGDLVLSSIDPRQSVFPDSAAEQLLTKYPSSDELKVVLAFNKLASQDFESAEQILTQLQLPGVLQSTAASYLAYCSAQLDHWDNVQIQLSQLSEAKSWNNVYAWIAAGLWYEQQESSDQALQCYFGALQVYNADTEALTAAARLLGSQNNLSDAQILSERLITAGRLKELMDQIGKSQQGEMFRDKTAIAKLIADLKSLDRHSEARYWLQTYFPKAEVKEFSTAADHGAIPSSLAGYLPKSIPLVSRPASPPSPTPLAERSNMLTDAQSVQFSEMANQLDLRCSYHNGNDPQQNGNMQLHQTVGGGIGVMDFDRDGYPDLYLQEGVAGAGRSSGTLFRNVYGTLFERTSARAGIANPFWGQGVAVGDFDADGFADLFLANVATNTLWHNLGDGTFEAIELEKPLSSGNILCASAAIGDITNDGLPDIVCVNYVDIDEVLAHGDCISHEGKSGTCAPSNFAAPSDTIYQNADQFLFNMHSVDKDNFHSNDGHGLGIIVANFDRQLGNDVYISNDMDANELLIGKVTTQGQMPTFRDEAVSRGVAYDASGTPQASMGIAAGDFNRDGFLDLFVTNFYHEPNVVYLARSGGSFADKSRQFGFSTTNKRTLGFGTQAVDLDGNGYLDLVILNGHITNLEKEGKPYRMPAEVYLGSSSGFTLHVPSDKYFSEKTLGRSLAMVDFDRDLRMDLVASHLDRPAAVLRNESKGGDRIHLELSGTESDRDGVGSIVEIKCGDETWTRDAVRGDGYAASNENMLDIAVGRAETIDQITIHWPIGTTQTFENVATGQRYLAIENQSELVLLP